MSVRKMSVSELNTLIKETIEEMSGVTDVEDAGKKTREIDADEWADTLEKKIDMKKALKIKEHKALLYLESIRREQMAIEESLKEAVGMSATRKHLADKKAKMARAKARQAEREKAEKKATDEAVGMKATKDRLAKRKQKELRDKAITAAKEKRGE